MPASYPSHPSDTTSVLTNGSSCREEIECFQINRDCHFDHLETVNKDPDSPEMDIPISDIKPYYKPPSSQTSPNNIADSPTIQKTIQTLNLQIHPEGGYFVETDRSQLRIPNPHRHANLNPTVETDDDATRAASTTIYYMLTPSSPLGAFHRNASRTVHTLHRGRGRYVIIHADQAARHGGKAPVESFVVGHRLEEGERLQWIVEGGKFKSSYLLPDSDAGETEGLLISEVRYTYDC
ncbi:cupin domain-containing protein [Aspergillus melleus]|uniref:cupin domain-containing protein n=1 Tax=Aspergillus melleus TaxID=138277 RepID=UPI001E8EDD5F|nr:uncharacterized protein LDX57_003119 [Aspergillus melleus]KAH8425364.1 hypothetical protein LDX57_003119 [Aspergillus melleus]